MGLKNYLQNRKYDKQVKNVNSAAKTLSSNGLGYSVTSGITGDKSRLSLKDLKKVNKAAHVMNYYSAGYYTGTAPVRRSSSEIKSVRYSPLKFANYRKVQEKTIKQLYSNAHLRAAVTGITRTLYDTRIQTEINRFDLGLTAEESQNWVSSTERRWNIDKELKSWDYYLDNNYAQIADIAKWSYIGLGEFFAIIRTHLKGDDRDPGISIQMISPFQVQTPIGKNITDGNYVDQGIEFNNKGIKVAIWVVHGSAFTDYKRIEINNKSGFKQVLHGFIQKEPGQIRGIPDAAKSWHEFMSIEDMLKFEMDSAKINSTISGSVSAQDANATPSARANLKNIGVSRLNGGSSWGGGSSIPLENKTGQDITYDVRAVDSGGFIVQNLPPGYQYKEHDTKRPNVNIPEFIEKDLEYIYTANFGMSVKVVTQRLEGSYNASKAAIDLTWKQSIEYYLKQFESDFDRDVYKAWVAFQVGSGKIIVSDWSSKRESWLGMRVITPTKPSLNPKVDAQTSDIRIENSTSNHEYECQVYNGTSFSENIERLKRENVAKAEAFSVLEDGK